MSLWAVIPNLSGVLYKSLWFCYITTCCDVKEDLGAFMRYLTCLPYLIPCTLQHFNLPYVAFEIIEIKTVHDFIVK